jgi:hypothetical protein
MKDFKLKQSLNTELAYFEYSKLEARSLYLLYVHPYRNLLANKRTQGLDPCPSAAPMLRPVLDMHCHLLFYMI